MQRQFVLRLGQTMMTLLGMAIVVFFIVRLVGDPAAAMMPRTASREELDALRHSLGYDRPLSVQFLDYMSHAVTGDLGKSLYFGDTVISLILDRLPATLELALAGLSLAVVLGVPLGMIAAHKPGSIVDAAARLVGLIGQAAPGYWVALILIIIFAVQLHLVPAVGRGGLRSIILPAITVSLSTLGYLTRLTRANMLEVLHQDYIRTARSKGLGEGPVYLRHALKNVAIPLATLVGVQFGYLVGGSVFIETVFAWPGIGRLAYQAISVRDFPLVQGVAIFAGFFVSITNLIMDLLYAIINPQIRYR
jgi:ABC-type dipeptide/oligopeptide/nickel transport system permease component